MPIVVLLAAQPGQASPLSAPPLSEARSVVLSPPLCKADAFPLVAFVDALRVELAGRGLHCCTLATPGDGIPTAPSLHVKVEIAPCAADANRVQVSAYSPADSRTVERQVSLADVVQPARPRALALAVAELIRSLGQGLRGELSETIAVGSVAPPPSRSEAARPIALSIHVEAEARGLPTRQTMMWGGRVRFTGRGQGDVVRDFTDATHAAGMRVGFYLSPWDEHYPSSSPDYETYFRNQLSELLTHYGPVDEIYLDGYNAPTSLNWKGIAQLAKQLQPNLLVWMGPEIAATGADLRWIGNQTGQGSRSTLSVGNVPNGGPSNVWYPPDAPVSDRNPNWFWHPNNTVMSLKSLQTIYFNTVGMNTTLMLNVPPATTGQFDTPDISLLQQFGTWYSSLYQTNFVRGQPTTADSTWETTGFGTANLVDDDVSTYWAAASGARSARIEVTPASVITFSVVSIREPIELGERATKYHVEIKRNGTWNRSPTDASGAIVAGTVIGQRQLWQLNSTTAEAIALVIDSAKDVPAISEFSVY